MELPATRKTATEEDRGEDNKDPDWLIEQSIARQVAGGVLHCATAIESCCNRCKKQNWVLLRATKMLWDKLQRQHVTPCNFLSNLCRKGVARQVAEKIAQCNKALTYKSISILHTHKDELLNRHRNWEVEQWDYHLRLYLFSFVNTSTQHASAWVYWTFEWAYCLILIILKGQRWSLC